MNLLERTLDLANKIYKINQANEELLIDWGETPLSFTLRNSLVEVIYKDGLNQAPRIIVNDVYMDRIFEKYKDDLKTIQEINIKIKEIEKEYTELFTNSKIVFYWNIVKPDSITATIVRNWANAGSLEIKKVDGVIEIVYNIRGIKNIEDLLLKGALI